MPAHESKCCYIGLGSNLEDSRLHIERAFSELASLPQTQLTARSSLYGSKAVGPIQPDYINAVAAVATTLEPLALLDRLQAIEQAHRRRRTLRWGPRTLDLDILLYADRVMASERLTLPHPRLTERNFVLVPLVEIAPHLQLPDGRAVAALAARVGTSGLWQLE